MAQKNTIETVLDATIVVNYASIHALVGGGLGGTIGLTMVADKGQLRINFLRQV